MTTLTPSQQLRAAEQDERNERITEILQGVFDTIADKHARGQLMAGGCGTPDLLWEFAVHLQRLEAVGLTRRHGDIKHISGWLAGLACNLTKPSAAESN